MTKDLEWLKKEAYEKYERMKNNYEITGNNTDNGALKEAIKEGFVNGSAQQEGFTKAWLYGYEVKENAEN